MNRRKAFTVLGITAGIVLVTLGVFAANDWFPKTDPMSGQKYSWFGKKLPKNSTASAWNPIQPPPTPQLSKSYIYAGSRLLAVEDENATAAPPADIAVFRPSNGEWWVVKNTDPYYTYADWGIAGDIPVQGDYDGDGKTDFAIFRPGDGSWWVLYSSTSTYDQFFWGNEDSIPVVGDFDGDGKTDLAYALRDLDQDQMEWYADPSGGGSNISGVWGLDTDEPAVADYDGDGKSDFAIYRPGSSEFYWVRSSDSAAGSVDLGSYSPVKVVSSDYDGDGKADPAVFTTDTAYWHVWQSTTNSLVSTQWGASGDTPVQNDYDGDGKTDLAVWTPLSSNSVWTIKRSSNGTTRTEYWGATGDIPVPAFYRR
jgi:hypothetical protein